MIQSRRVGVAAFVSLAVPLAALFHLLTSTDNLLDLYMAVKGHGDPNHVVAQLVGASLAIVGAALVAWLSPAPNTPSSAPPAETELK